VIPNNTGVWWFVGTVLISFAAILAVAYFMDDLLEWLKRTEYKVFENYRRKKQERKERKEEERRRKEEEKRKQEEEGKKPSEDIV
jgi:hypothetical protein